MFCRYVSVCTSREARRVRIDWKYFCPSNHAAQGRDRSPTIPFDANAAASSARMYDPTLFPGSLCASSPSTPSCGTARNYSRGAEAHNASQSYCVKCVLRVLAPAVNTTRACEIFTRIFGKHLRPVTMRLFPVMAGDKQKGQPGARVYHARIAVRNGPVSLG